MGNGNMSFLGKIIQTIRKQRTFFVCLCAMVVFVTTYLLILPAITLDKDTAKDQGGIDLPKAEQVQDTDQADVTDQIEDTDKASVKAEDKAAIEKPVGGELSYEGKGYTVETAFDAKAGLPEDTELEAIEIASDDKDYEAWYDEALKALQEAEGGEQVTSLEFAKFYDISLMADGQTLEPEAPVDVSISYDKALKADDADHIRIVHFGTDKKGNLVPEVLDPDDVELNLKKGKMSGTAFAAESFSVYGIVYTVDFHWEVDGKTFEYNLEGGSSIKISELFEVLSIDVDVEEVADVAFSDPSLIKISQSDGDWTLKSLKAFDTEESLTVTMENGDSFVVKVTDWVEGAYGQSINIDIYGDGSITLGEYIQPFDWDWMGTYDYEERNTYYSYRTLSLSVRYGSNTNNQDIAANPASGYVFDHWELRDGMSSNVTTYPSAVIPAGTLSFSNGSTLTAVFKKSSQGGGGHIDFHEITQEWIEKITKDQPTVDKTASVYDYKNRIYQIDISASSELYAVNQNLDVDFVTDVSGSMLFPSKLETVATFSNSSDMFTQLDNVVRQNHHGNLPNNTPVGEMYYMNLDPHGASNVFVLRRYNGQWWALAAAYTDEEINASVIRGRGYDNWRPLNVADINGEVIYTNFSSQNTVEKKIYMATDSTKRLEYLQQALYLVRDVLYKVNPDAQIGLTTFAASANQGRFYSGSQRSELESAIRNIATEGGTNQADGLAKGKALLDTDTDSTKKKVAVLITDGAPNGCTWPEIQRHSQIMKNAGIDVYTVGLSVENVEGASDGLYYTSNGYGYAFDAKDGRGLVEAIESIIQSVITKANMTGSVSDTIDPAFYPVAQDGTPLQPGVEYEDKNGHKYTVVKNGESWTVNWQDQSFGWAYTDMQGKQPGWKGTVYVKAKENFLGGNAIKTNSGSDSDKVTVNGFKTFTYDDDDEEVILNSGILKDEDGNPKTIIKKLDTPYVNVDELALTSNSTEWNVYLGTEVDPKSELEKLLRKIDIRKVVSADNNEMITSKDQMLGGTSTSSKTMSLTEYLGLTTDNEIKALVNDLLTNGTKTFQYNNSFNSTYGHGYVGDIVISLVDTSGCYNKENHATEAVGKDAEFTLKVEYQPKENSNRNIELDITADDYHTTSGGSPGEPVPKTGNDMISTNNHVINVYAKGLQITKKDQLFENKITGAEFKLYRTARDGETQNLKVINGRNYYPVAVLDMTSSSTAAISQIETLKTDEEYYLVETKAPAGYLMLEDPIPVNLELTDSFISRPGGESSQARPSADPYDWTQTSKLTLGPSGWVRRTDESGEADLTHTALDGNTNTETMYYDIANDAGAELPSSGGPGTTWIYLIGSILLLGCGTILVARRRTRRAS